VKDWMKKKGVAAISILLILPSVGFAQSPTHDPSSTEGVGRIALMVEIGQLQRSAALKFRHSGQALDRGSSKAQPNTRSGHPALIGAATYFVRASCSSLRNRSWSAWRPTDMRQMIFTNCPIPAKVLFDRRFAAELG
jgi:hypothetical protein